jgi:hypothetical protein
MTVFAHGSCENCRFYEESRRECRRYAPQIWEMYSMFPSVKPHEWCGEFEPKHGHFLPDEHMP